MLVRKILVTAGLFFFCAAALHARPCTETDVKKAVKEVYDLYSLKGHSKKTQKQVMDLNKNDFMKRCDGLYVFINVGVTNLVHVSPKLHDKPLPALKDKTPQADGKPKDFFKEFMMNAKKKPAGSFVNYVWTGADDESLVCKSSYIMGAKDPKNPKKLYIIGAGFTKNDYHEKGAC